MCQSEIFFGSAARARVAASVASAAADFKRTRRCILLVSPVSCLPFNMSGARASRHTDEQKMGAVIPPLWLLERTGPVDDDLGWCARCTQLNGVAPRGREQRHIAHGRMDP